MLKLLEDDTVWAGSEASYHAVLEAEQAIAARLKAGGWDEDDDEDEGSRLLQVKDGVAVLSIHGSLVNSDSWFLRFFGMTGYPEIREALVEAASNSEVKEILLDIDSPGGAVSGVSDTAGLIRTINDRVKPVTTFTENTMASAGYWLGSSAGRVFNGRMATVGSIGVIATHMERSKQLASAGVGVSVIRSGKWKGLINGVEPLSEEGRKQLQDQVDATAAVFTEHVATMRGRTAAYVDEHMGQGRVFVGQDAANVGLTDGIKSFDALMSEVLARSIDPSKKLMDNRRNAGGGYGASLGNAEHGDMDMTKKKALTEQDIAALAAGAPLAADASAGVGGEVPEKVAESEEVAGEVVETTEATDEGAAGVTADVATSNETVRLLKEQLKATQDEVLEAKIALRKADEKLAETLEVVGPLSEVVVKAINNMQVALGGTALDLSGMAPSALVKEHAKMVEQFHSKFKAGGVAAVDASQSDTREPQVSALAKARLSAVRSK